MRSFVRAGFVLTLAIAACNKDSAAPVDFENPLAVSSNLSEVESTFDSDVFRSFNAATFMLSAAAASAPSIRPATTLLGAVRPKLERTGGQAFLPGLIEATKLQGLPQLSVSTAQGAIIPDSMYGRVFEWDATISDYEYQGTTVSNLNGVRFILYAVGLGGEIAEPVTPIGTLDIIDQSTTSLLKLQVLVKNTAGTTTYVDYTIQLQGNETSAQAVASGEISNGQSGDNLRILSFEQTLTVNANGARVVATFALNNPAITMMLNESVTVTEDDVIINADFRLIINGQTIRTVGRITVEQLTQALVVAIRVSVDGHPVASINGDPTLPETQWVDAGGEPLTLADLAALDHLFDALERFDTAIGSLFAPIATFANL